MVGVKGPRASHEARVDAAEGHEDEDKSMKWVLDEESKNPDKSISKK